MKIIGKILNQALKKLWRAVTTIIYLKVEAKITLTVMQFLGETRKFTYLQRIGIVKSSQGLGLGNNLLNCVINFAVEKSL